MAWTANRPRMWVATRICPLTATGDCPLMANSPRFVVAFSAAEEPFGLHGFAGYRAGWGYLLVAELAHETTPQAFLTFHRLA